MIWWLIGNLYWLLPALLVLGVGLALAFGVWPVVVATFGRLPPLAQALALVVLATLIAGSGMYAKGKADGLASCRATQAGAEDRADAKGAKVAAGAQAKAQEARTDIRKETSDVQVRIREVVRTVPGACPAMPDELRDLLQRQVEAARAELPATARDRDRGRAD